jgi:hypothetical protein
VPLAEDDAQVGRVPGEEHLWSGVSWRFQVSEGEPRGSD